MKFLDKFGNSCDHEVDHLVSEAWVDAKPKGVVGDDVGIGERANDPMWHTDIGRLAHEIAAKQKTGANAAALDVLDQVES